LGVTQTSCSVPIQVVNDRGRLSSHTNILFRWPKVANNGVSPSV
jgi:hypothetical protein